VAVALDLDEDDTGPNAIPDVARSALFRIAQESITNAIEHGGASRILVRLRLPEPEGAIELDVQDNGDGFPWGSAQPDLSALADDGHFGLVGMHERAAAIGGTLVLSPEGLEGRGARVRVTLPDLRRTGPLDPSVRRPRHPAHA
jgi:signal transduction histidine kinase